MRKFVLLSITAAAFFAQPAFARDPQFACVSAPFMVFFDFDSDKITPQGRAILDNAAATFATCKGAEVLITGHTDTMGDARYNIGLSQRIAANTRSYLVSLGIPARAITIEAFGEARPLVDTPDGVQEPQNRRAEITFRPDSSW